MMNNTLDDVLASSFGIDGLTGASPPAVGNFKSSAFAVASREGSYYTPEKKSLSLAGARAISLNSRVHSDEQYHSQ